MTRRLALRGVQNATNSERFFIGIATMMKPQQQTKKKTGRFSLVKRIKKQTKRKSLQESSSVDEPLNLKNVQRDSPSSAVTIDVLGRESISTLDTEREDDYCEQSVVYQEEEVAAPATPQQVAPREQPSIHTLGKHTFARFRCNILCAHLG